MQTIHERAGSDVRHFPRPISATRAGLIAGVFLACWHAGWCVLVAAGWAKSLVDFVFWLHFLSMPIQVQEFALGRAIGLVAFTFAVGYAFGWTFIRIREAGRNARRG